MVRSHDLSPWEAETGYPQGNLPSKLAKSWPPVPVRDPVFVRKRESGCGALNINLRPPHVRMHINVHISPYISSNIHSCTSYTCIDARKSPVVSNKKWKFSNWLFNMIIIQSSAYLSITVIIFIISLKLIRWNILLNTSMHVHLCLQILSQNSNIFSIHM